MFRLTRHFSLMSAITMAAITTALVAGYQWVQTRDLHMHTAERNTAVARLISAVVWSEHLDTLAGAELLDASELRHRPQTMRLDIHMRSLTQGLGVLKVKIYSPAGLTVYSSEHSQIGESKAREKAFRSVVASR